MATAKKSWRNVLPIHPAAELFPRMSNDDLRAIGEDIKANGLTSPIAITRSKKARGWEYRLVWHMPQDDEHLAGLLQLHHVRRILEAHQALARRVQGREPAFRERGGRLVVVGAGEDEHGAVHVRHAAHVVRHHRRQQARPISSGER